MKKIHFIPSDSKIVRIPTSEKIQKYLNESNLWEKYKDIGYKCIHQDDNNNDIIIINEKFVRTEDNVFYDEQLLSVISLMAAVGKIEKEELIQKIDHEIQDYNNITIEKALSLLLLWNEIDLYDITDEDKEICAGIYFRCNDVFAWGCGDAEPVAEDDILPLFQEVIKDKDYGSTKWCIKKRKMPPQALVIHWMKCNDSWSEEMELLHASYIKDNPEYKFEYGMPGGGYHGNCFKIIKHHTEDKPSVYFENIKNEPNKFDNAAIEWLIANCETFDIVIPQKCKISKKWSKFIENMVSKGGNIMEEDNV